MNLFGKEHATLKWKIRVRGSHLTFIIKGEGAKTIPLSSCIHKNDKRKRKYEKKISNWLNEISKRFKKVTR